MSTRRQFLAGAAGVTGTALLSAPLRGAVLRDSVVRPHSGFGDGRERIRSTAVPFSLRQVRLLAGPCLEVQEANRRYLHSLPVDRLAHMFRVNELYAATPLDLSSPAPSANKLKPAFFAANFRPLAPDTPAMIATITALTWLCMMLAMTPSLTFGSPTHT
jgi:hypothetical protein